MKIITRQKCADEVVEKWERVYGKAQYGADKLVILRLLKQLPKPVDPDEVDRIIGNTSWTYTHHCSQCGQQSEVVIEVGQEPDYESATAWLCVPCVRKLAKFAEGL
jgi:hypothetical protein